MTRTQRSPARPLLLGIEAGATRTVALLADPQERLVQRLEAGPANLRLLDDPAITRHFRQIAHALPSPAAIAIGMAGARTPQDRARILHAAALSWPGVPCLATNDLETALHTLKPSRSASPARVLVLSGTGSCCFGHARTRRTAKIGGWGHLLGDKGSAYEIGLRALKAVVYYLDRDGRWPKLGLTLLRSLQLNEPDDLIGWVQRASKTDIAALAVPVGQAWVRRDPIAADILHGAAHSLARDAASCARRLAPRGGPVQFLLAGSVLLKQPRFAALVRRQIRRHWPGARVTSIPRESAWGAVHLASTLLPPRPTSGLSQTRRQTEISAGKTMRRIEANPSDTSDGIPENLGASPTEQRNPRSMNLDRLSPAAAIRLMLDEERSVVKALLVEQKSIQRGLGLIVRSLRHGGRLFYVGAGTSGRLGVLDASECPPTFRTDPSLVQGIIAGGQRALWEAVEGAEDDAPAGAQAVAFRQVTRRDTVVGIAASGRTPFVWGALREARRRGAATILLCFNPQLVIPGIDRPTLVLAPRIGPEILTGSTRLKAGTATKLILNIFTTLAMVRLGKVKGNLMIDLSASNAKLRDRAVRIVRELTGADPATARTALVQAHWKIKSACSQLSQLSRRHR